MESESRIEECLWTSNVAELSKAGDHVASAVVLVAEVTLRLYLNVQEVVSQPQQVPAAVSEEVSEAGLAIAAVGSEEASVAAIVEGLVVAEEVLDIKAVAASAVAEVVETLVVAEVVGILVLAAVATALVLLQ